MPADFRILKHHKDLESPYAQSLLPRYRRRSESATAAKAYVFAARIKGSKTWLVVGKDNWDLWPDQMFPLEFMPANDEARAQFKKTAPGGTR